MFGSTAPCSPLRLACAAIPALALFAGTAAMGQEIVVKNDNLPDNPSGLQTFYIRGFFNALEEVNVWLTAPCNGEIVAVQVLWASSNGSQAASLEESIRLYQPGTFPSRSNTMLVNAFGGPGTPAELLGPAMGGNGLYEFRFLDENNTVPLSVPVTAGQQFVVSFEFGENHSDDSATNPLGTPSIPIDTDGCNAQPWERNGIFGLPGGFLPWCQLTQFCSNPQNGQCTGDFVVRVKMTCAPVTGACCLPNGACQNAVSQTICQAQGGTWQGADSSCAQVTCTVPTGACCTSTGCQTLTEAQCTTAGGTYRGNNTLCSTAGICNGQCCIPSTQGCSASVNQAQCTALGGTFQGVGTNCASTVCFPMGACCLENGTCLAGPMTPAQCVAQGGTFKGHLSTCSTPCPQPIGKCCVPVGGNYVCLDGIEQGECATAFGGAWGGPNSACASGSEQCPPCFADINTDASVNVTDLLAVIGGWGPCSNCPADIAPSPFGDNQVNVSDLLMVIGQWGTCQ